MSIYDELWRYQKIRERAHELAKEFNQPSQTPTLEQVQELCSLLSQLTMLVRKSHEVGTPDGKTIEIKDDAKAKEN